MCSSKYFEMVILIFILISSISLAIENPLEPADTTKSTALYYLNNSLTIIFSLEILIKLIAYGVLFNGPNSYFRSYWNIFDFLIVLLSIISVIVN